MFGAIGASIEVAAQHPRITAVMLIVMTALCATVVVEGIRYEDKMDAAYTRGFNAWMNECKGDRRKIDDCTMAWSRDDVLRSIYVKP